MPSDMTRLLVARLKDLLTNGAGQRRLCILLGAGATTPFVPGVADLTQLARQFADEVSDSTAASGSGQVSRPVAVQADRINQYSEALELVKRVRGVDGVLSFVQQAVLKPYEGPLPAEFPSRPLTADEVGELEKDTRNWRIPPGLKALAAVIAKHSGRVCTHLLTTNFDLLLQVALREAGIEVATFAAPHDGTPVGMRQGPGARVVAHLHGDCRGGTLHSPVEIRRNRPSMENWLRHHLHSKTLLVVGYSGWDDIIGRILRTELDEAGTDNPALAADVLWAVYENENEHGNINATLADFFRDNSQRVTAYYGIDRDRLFVELAESLQILSPPTSQPLPTFYNRVQELTDYGFSHSPISRTVMPKLIFWPHRLRKPHLIHGVHALTAVMFSRLSIPVELHLDDTEMTEAHARRLAAEFTEAVHAWFSVCGVDAYPKIYRIKELLNSMDGTDAAARLWTLAEAFYARTTSVFDALAGAKVIDAEGSNIGTPGSGAHRLLRPLYTWFALEHALDRHNLAKVDDAPVVTLSGRDEQRLWDLWRSRTGVPSVASVYVPYLEPPTESTDLWLYSQLHRDALGQDLTKFVRKIQAADPTGEQLEWAFNTGIRLAATVSNNALTLNYAGRNLDTWESTQAALRADPMGVSAALSRAVARWFHAEAT